jgi:hypothetical protein
MAWARSESRATMQLDIERYRPYVDHFDMPEEQKIELIHIVSRIMQSFVERAFGKSPEQVLLGTDFHSASDPDAVELDSFEIHTTFNNAAQGDAEKESSDDR